MSEICREVPFHPMTIDEIKELIEIVNESGIAELEVARGDDRVRIRRTNGPAPQEIVLPSAQLMNVPPQASVPASAAGVPSAGVLSPVVVAEPVPDPATIYIKSPIVGTYYDSPTPGSAPFVKVGDRVTNGQVLCIIESMKLMNEIESEMAGTLIARLMENGKPVEYGESLFAIQPA